MNVLVLLYLAVLVVFAASDLRPRGDRRDPRIRYRH